MTEKSVFDLTQRGSRTSFYRQVMPTVSGFSPVFSTLKLDPREQAEADFEADFCLPGALGSLSLLSMAH